MPHCENRPVIAALAALIILPAVMLAALFAGIRPHPPETTPLFGIGPFIGTAIAAATASIITQPIEKLARSMSVVAALLAAISFGPQKYMDAQFHLIWPAVVAGQIAILTILLDAALSLRSSRSEPPSPV